MTNYSGGINIIGLKPETISRFKSLYKDFPELIEYKIKSGNTYEKAKATLIKNVAENDLQASECLAAPTLANRSRDKHVQISDKSEVILYD